MNEWAWVCFNCDNRNVKFIYNDSWFLNRRFHIDKFIYLYRSQLLLCIHALLSLFYLLCSLTTKIIQCETKRIVYTLFVQCALCVGAPIDDDAAAAAATARNGSANNAIILTRTSHWPINKAKRIIIEWVELPMMMMQNWFYVSPFSVSIQYYRHISIKTPDNLKDVIIIIIIIVYTHARTVCLYYVCVYVCVRVYVTCLNATLPIFNSNWMSLFGWKQ